MQLPHFYSQQPVNSLLPVWSFTNSHGAGEVWWLGPQLPCKTRAVDVSLLTAEWLRAPCLLGACLVWVWWQ